MCWSSSSSELTTKGASWVVKRVASLALFLGFGLHSSSSSFLILLSCTCLEEWEGQGPDIRPIALGLYFLVGLGDQLLLLFRPCLPGSLAKADTSVCLLLCKSCEFVLSYLLGGVVSVPRLPPGGGSPRVHCHCRLASRCFDIHLRVHCVLWHLDCHEDVSSACPSPSC